MKKGSNNGSKCRYLTTDRIQQTGSPHTFNGTCPDPAPSDLEEKRVEFCKQFSVYRTLPKGAPRCRIKIPPARLVK